ncbi:MAG: hypothetical protein HQ451_03845 [Candidatus Planktophila sp.]|nr:hypothetical protein [Candidatus Planktophila sp.]
MIILNLHYLLSTQYHPVDEYAKLELEQHSRLSRIRRNTQAIDEELARQSAPITTDQRIA